MSSILLEDDWKSPGSRADNPNPWERIPVVGGVSGLIKTVLRASSSHIKVGMASQIPMYFLIVGLWSYQTVLTFTAGRYNVRFSCTGSDEFRTILTPGWARCGDFDLHIRDQHSAVSWLPPHRLAEHHVVRHVATSECPAGRYVTGGAAPRSSGRDGEICRSCPPSTSRSRWTCRSYGNVLRAPRGRGLLGRRSEWN